MCLATPAKIKSIKENKAKVEDSHGSREVSLELIKGPKIGDYLLVHGDLAINKIDKKEAKEILKLNKKICKATSR